MLAPSWASNTKSWLGSQCWSLAGHPKLDPGWTSNTRPWLGFQNQTQTGIQHEPTAGIPTPDLGWHPNTGTQLGSQCQQGPDPCGTALIPLAQHSSSFHKAVLTYAVGPMAAVGSCPHSSSPHVKRPRFVLLQVTQRAYWVHVDENIDFLLSGKSPIKKI